MKHHKYSKSRAEEEQWLRNEIECHALHGAEYVVIHVDKKNPQYIADSRTMSIDEMIEATRSLHIFTIQVGTVTTDSDGKAFLDLELCKY